MQGLRKGSVRKEESVLDGIADHVFAGYRVLTELA